MLTTNSTLPVLRYLFLFGQCQCAEVVSTTNSTPIVLCYLLPFFFFDLHLMNVVVLRTNSTRVVVLIPF